MESVVEPHLLIRIRHANGCDLVDDPEQGVRNDEGPGDDDEHAHQLLHEEARVSVEQAIGTTGKPFTMYIVVGAIYLGFSTVITLSVMVLEKYANRHLEVAR